MMFLQNLEGKFLAGLEVLDEVDFSEKAAAKELLHRKVFEIETIPTWKRFQWYWGQFLDMVSLMMKEIIKPKLKANLTLDTIIKKVIVL